MGMRILQEVHDGSHFGINRTRDMISEKYYWPGMSKYIQSYVCNLRNYILV